MHLDSVETTEHPAVRAWLELDAGRPKPTSIETLKRRNASQVYRMAGVGPDGSDVIAKRCPRSGGLAERTIYQEVLYRLPGRSLRFYGLVEDNGTEFCWVFLEDAGGMPYSPAVAEHGQLAAEWLAGLHTGALATARELCLPDRGSGCYLGSLRSGRDGIRVNLDNPALAENDGAVLTTIGRLCDDAETLWPRIEECCSAAPLTFVHSDLHAGNIHVSPDGNALLPFDWESAGWGVPAIDLGLPGLDLGVYSSAVGSVWPELQLGLIQRLALVGRLFQLLALVEWESKGLSSQWLYRPMKRMRYYLAEMSEALLAAELL